MTHSLKLFSMMLLCAMCSPPGLLGQVDSGSARNSVAIRAGYCLSAGDWDKVRYNPDINLLRGNFTIAGDINVRLSDRLALVLDGGYESLSGSDYEAHALSLGDNVHVSASLFYAGILLRPYFKVGKPDIVSIEFGPVLLFPSGQETFGGRTYQYDFFSSTKIGGEGAIAYDRVVNDSFAASLRIAGIFVPSGISYADGETRTLIALPVTLGMRFYF